MHRLLSGDARKLPGVTEAGVQLVVTSPPYPMIEMWDEMFGRASPAAAKALEAGDGPKAFEAMHADLDDVWSECFNALEPGGFLCVNVGDATRKIGERFGIYPNHARVLQACMQLGFTPLPSIVWRKQTNAPNKFMGSGTLPAGAYVTLEHEHILVLRKGDKREFEASDKARRRRSAFFWEERNKWFSDVWDFKGERQLVDLASGGRRSAAFPFELPYRLIAMYSLEGDTVLDPFSGTGTTSAAAAALGRNSVGVDLDKELTSMAQKRVASVGGVANERTRMRLAAHREFVRERVKSDASKPKHTNKLYGQVMSGQETDARLLTVEDATVVGGAVRVTHGVMQMPSRKDVSGHEVVRRRKSTKNKN